jgi:prepilin-type N-terminal cleavage/methylation domain-containing protein
MPLQKPLYAQISRGRIRVHKSNSESLLGELSSLNGLNAAFTLVEVMMAVAVMGVMLVTLYGGFTFAFAETRLARENVRATQILQEKMEIVRLYTWEQAVNTPGYMPTNFTEAFYSNNPTNTSTANFNYKGTVLLTAAPVSETYSGDLRMVQIKVSWKSGGITRKRQMTTFISQYGLQKYVY